MNKINQSVIVKRAFKLSLLNLCRNRFLSIATVAVIGIILFIFNIILAINFIAESSLQNLSQKVDLTVYLKETTTSGQAEKTIETLKTLDYVVDATYTSKEEALDKIKTTYPSIYDSFTKYDLGNPLPASISIKTKNPSYHTELENYLKGGPLSVYISNVRQGDSSPDQEKSIISSVAKNLQKVTDFSHEIIFWLVMTFVIGGTLIIFNAVQITIFSRRKEVNIMRLVGAPLKLIYLPFVIEGIFYAVFAILLNLLLLSILSHRINIEGLSLYNFSKNLDLSYLTILELSITIILSIGSSLLAVYTYLRRPLATEE